MLLSGLVIVMAVIFITYLPQYDITKESILHNIWYILYAAYEIYDIILNPPECYLIKAKPTDLMTNPVAAETKLLQQIKPIGLVNATAVTCCTCTMALFCIQSTLEVVLIRVQNILIV